MPDSSSQLLNQCTTLNMNHNPNTYTQQTGMSSEETETCSWKPRNKNRGSKARSTTHGLDTGVWGKLGWDTQLLLAYSAALPEEDPEGAVAHAAHTAYLCEALTTPCGVCGAFYARHLLATCADPGFDPHVARTQWFDVVAELKLMVEAKISTGKGADASILRWGGKQVEGLRKRVSTMPPIMTWTAYTDFLLLKAEWMEREARRIAAAEDKPLDAELLRAFITLVTLLAAHARTLAPLLPQWSATLYATASLSSSILSSPEVLTRPRALFRLIWNMRKDMAHAAAFHMPRALREESMDAAHARLVGSAGSTLLGWYRDTHLRGEGRV